MKMLKDTIISAFNYDGTLLKWLKKVEDALQNASASEFRVNKKGNATISFSIVFANGDTLESGDIILQQGESVTGATIRQGHLILTLSNGNELDAGDLGAVTGFSINESQHLIVTYQNGNIQDLGAIFNGNVNINGNLTANSIIENMSGYTFTKRTDYLTWDVIYAGCVKNGNKLTFVIFGKLTAPSATWGNLAYFLLPTEIANKLQSYHVGDTDALDNRKLIFNLVTNRNTFVDGVVLTSKQGRGIYYQLENLGSLTAGEEYYFRIEQTFLLSDNMAG